MINHKSEPKRNVEIDGKVYKCNGQGIVELTGKNIEDVKKASEG